MVAMSLQALGLRPAQLKAIERKAKHTGKTPAEYVRLLIERDLLADKPFNELLRPIRQDFQKSGITEKQLAGIIRRARRAPPPRSSRPGTRKTSR